MMNNQSNFPNKKWEVLQVKEKIKKNPKITTVDVIGGRFKV